MGHFRHMAVLLNRLEQMRKVVLACLAFDLSRDIRISASGPDELVIESAKVDLLFSPACHFAFGYARSDFILDDNAQQPSAGRVSGRYLENADGCDFGQILPLLVAEVKFGSD